MILSFQKRHHKLYSLIVVDMGDELFNSFGGMAKASPFEISILQTYWNEITAFEEGVLLYSSC